MNELLHRFIVAIEHNENIKMWCCEKDGWSFSLRAYSSDRWAFQSQRSFIAYMKRRSELFAWSLCVCCVLFGNEMNNKPGSKNLSGICYFFLHQIGYCPFQKGLGLKFRQTVCSFVTSCHIFTWKIDGFFGINRWHENLRANQS